MALRRATSLWPSGRRGESPCDRQGGVPAVIHSGLVRINEVRQTALPAITAGALPAGPVEIELRTPSSVERARLPNGETVEQVIVGSAVQP